jgi:polyhydroxyalkanoate synthesis regulator phasin
MFTTLKRAVLIGLGASERTKEVLDSLAQKGAENPSEGAKKMRAFFELGERVETECSQKLKDICERVGQVIRVPSRSDIERLEKGLADLAERVHGMTGGATPAGGK